MSAFFNSVRRSSNTLPLLQQPQHSHSKLLSVRLLLHSHSVRPINSHSSSLTTKNPTDTQNLPSATDSLPAPSHPEPSNPPHHHSLSQSAPAKSLRLTEISRLVGLARPETAILSISAGLLVVSSSVSLSVPFLWGKLIDIFTDPQLADSLSISLPTATALLTGFFLIGSGANTTRIILMHIAGQRIVRRLRISTFGAILRADMSWHDLRSSAPSGTPTSNHGGTGDLVSRLGNDCNIVGDSITRDLADGSRALITTVSGVSMMFFISSKLTLLMLTVVPPTAIGAVFFGQYLKKLTTASQQALGQMVDHAEERINSIRAVHTFNSVPIEIKTFEQRVNRIFELARREAFARAIDGFTGNVTIVALLTYGGTLVSRGEISVGDLSSLMLYTAYVGSSLIGLSSWFATVMKGLGAGTRIFDVLDAKPVSVKIGEGHNLDRSEPLRPILFSDVRFKYPARPEVDILNGLDLQIVPGTSLAIAGSSGSGKSTIASLLLRFYDPQAGGVYYGDQNVKSFTPESWRSNIGFVPQDPALLSGTILENITYGLPASLVPFSRIEQAVRSANAMDFINGLPQRFETEIGSKGTQLSGGQKQRLAIARALVRQPKLLILDEATSALDTKAEQEVNLAIQRVMRERSLTTMIIAHRLSTLKMADRIVFMSGGKITESGTYEELSKEGTEFNRMIKTQLLKI
ncbi:P-loop containing nucleoside triphosphate hydrolase protein [Phakopsora pachyrhizi]|nr:P-loop containing nucleoside triphosphate hydrolase protein [Phakopsora pachyrhizi]